MSKTMHRPMPSHFGDTKPKPGVFKATCNLSRPWPVKDLPHYLRREYEEKGWQRAQRTITRGRGRDAWEARVECFLEPLCDGFETDDRAAFEQHMKTVHGKRSPNGENAGLSKRAKGKWRGPRLSEDGTEFKTSDKAIDELVRTCACGLVAEVRPESYASIQWWNEHVSFCTKRGAA